MCGICSGGFLSGLEFSVYVTPVVYYFPFNSDIGSFFLKYVMCTVNYVSINDKLLCAGNFIVENLKARPAVEILLAHRSEVLLTHGTNESQVISFCNELESDVSC